MDAHANAVTPFIKVWVISDKLAGARFCFIGYIIRLVLVLDI